MLTLLRREPKITLHACSAWPGLVDILPPQRLLKLLPEWWKSLPDHVSLTETVGPTEGHERKLMTAKHCYGMQELFKRAIGLRLWCDIEVTVMADGHVLARRPGSTGQPGVIHPEAQHRGAIGSSGQHYKLYSPWAFVCNSEIQFAWIHPFYHQSDAFRFHTMPGIVEYRNQHSTNVNMIFPRPRAARSELTLSAGEVIAYIVPLTEATIDLSPQEVSTAEMQRINCAEKVSFKPIMFRRKFNVPPFHVAKSRD
jgi:hypothetical protein